MSELRSPMSELLRAAQDDEKGIVIPYPLVPAEPDKVGDPADLIGWLRFSDDVQDADRFAIVRLREVTNE